MIFIDTMVNPFYVDYEKKSNLSGPLGHLSYKARQ